MSGATQQFGPINPLKILIPVLVMMLVISAWSRWYAQSVSLPRYCEDPAHYLQLLEKILTRPEPAGEDNRRPYLVAAKLRFLLPQQSQESVPDYLARLKQHMHQQCAA